jgi:hypothetical protein
MVLMLYISCEGQERRYMKKLFLLFFTVFMLVKPVFAEEAKITYKRLPGIYFNQRINGNLESNNVTMFYLNERIAYCIEPGASINEHYYDKADWSSVNFSLEVKDYIEKVGYYGFEYPSHQTDRYYIAAQELIWNKTNPDIEVSWSTGKNMTGDIIDVSKEKNEILNLVNKHSLLPSFSTNLIKDKVAKTVVLEDTNDVLSDYDISDSKYHKIVKNGNKLEITLNSSKVDDEVLTLTRKHFDDLPLIIYSRGNSQKMAALRITTDKSTFIKISNEEEEIEVPNTGGIQLSGFVGMALMGIGLICVKIY